MEGQQEFVLITLTKLQLEELIIKCVNEALKSYTPKEQENQDELLTLKEAAEFLKVSEVSIHNWKRVKGLRFYRIGRSIRFKKVDLIEFAEVKRKKTGLGSAYFISLWSVCLQARIMKSP